MIAGFQGFQIVGEAGLFSPDVGGAVCSGFHAGLAYLFSRTSRKNATEAVDFPGLLRKIGRGREVAAQGGTHDPDARL